MQSYGEIVIRLYIKTHIDNLAEWLDEYHDFTTDSTQFPNNVYFRETPGSFAKRRVYYLIVEPVGIDEYLYETDNESYPDEDYFNDEIEKPDFHAEGLVTIDIIDDFYVLFVCWSYLYVKKKVFDNLFEGINTYFFPDQHIYERIMDLDNDKEQDKSSDSSTLNIKQKNLSEETNKKEYEYPIPTILLDRDTMQQYFLGGSKGKHNILTAQQIYSKIPEARKIFASNPRRKIWNYILISKEAGISESLTSTYLGAFILAGVKTINIDGVDIPIPHNFRESTRKKYLKK